MSVIRLGRCVNFKWKHENKKEKKCSTQPVRRFLSSQVRQPSQPNRTKPTNEHKSTCWRGGNTGLIRTDFRVQPGHFRSFWIWAEFFFFCLFTCCVHYYYYYHHHHLNWFWLTRTFRRPIFILAVDCGYLTVASSLTRDSVEWVDVCYSVGRAE